jgi:6-phosphogluconolactonase
MMLRIQPPTRGLLAPRVTGMTTPPLVLIANAGDSTISSFALDADRLRPLATTPVAGSCSTFAVDARRNLVYAGVKGDPPAILTLTLDRATGRLTQVGRKACGGALHYLELTPGGALLLGASYHAGAGAVWPVAAGVLADPSAEIRFPNLHCVKTTADGAFAYFVSLGAELIAQYALYAAGALTPLEPATAPGPAGSGPRHLTLSADERDAYLITEFSGEVVRYARSASGRLTAAESLSIVDPAAGLGHSRFGADPRAEHLIWGADLHLARGGAFLLASERTAGTLATVHLDGGVLREVVALRPTEPQPRGFAVAPDGVHVVAVGELSTEAALYRLGEDGVLADADRVETGSGANWVRILA